MLHSAELGDLYKSFKADYPMMFFEVRTHASWGPHETVRNADSWEHAVDVAAVDNTSKLFL